MRTLVVTHYFPPEIGAPQARLSELARFWAEAGDEVTVLTGMPNHPTGVVPPEYRRRMRIIESVDGYRVVRTWLYATPNEGVLRKTLGHLSFMASSVVLGARLTGPADVVVVSSPTFFAIFSAWLLARMKRARLVVEVRDLWPAIFVELGILTNPWIIRALEAAELAAYRAADAVVVVSEGFRQNIVGRGIPSHKVHTIRNGVDLQRFHPDAGDRAAARRQLGVDDDQLLVLYAGAHGVSHGLHTVLEAAAMIDPARVQVRLVGEGSARSALVSQARELKLVHVQLLPGVPRSQVPDLLAAADLCLVPLRDVPLFAIFIPSKMFEYLAAGRPVVGALTGEAAQILRDAGQEVVPPEDPERLAEVITALAEDPERRQAMGRAGRRYVGSHFDRRTLAERYRSLLEGLLGR